MIVVSNTSPLNYLILIQAIEILPRLYHQIFVPMKVLEELADPRSPTPVQLFAKHTPPWIVGRVPSFIDPSLKLHAGETHAIALGIEMNADRLLMDERRGYQAAKANGLRPVGILGILYEASGKELVDLPQAFDRLLGQTNFHCDKIIMDEVLRRDADRQGK